MLFFDLLLSVNDNFGFIFSFFTLVNSISDHLALTLSSEEVQIVLDNLLAPELD